MRIRMIGRMGIKREKKNKLNVYDNEFINVFSIKTLNEI